MDILLATTGSAGDVYPFIALGRALARRGHWVTLAAPGSFGDSITRLGLDFIPLDRPKSSETASVSRRLSPGRALKKILGLAVRPLGRRWIKLARASTIAPLIRPLYEIVARRCVAGRTVLVASSPLLGARVAHERLGVSLITVHLSPAMLRSAYQPPVQPPLRLPAWLPAGAKRAAYRLLDALVLDPLLADGLNRLRDELGLPRVHRVLHEWRHSPQRVIGLFPSWFAAPQPDWPLSLALTGFLNYDGSDTCDVPPPVEEFLDAGSPPIVLTPGSSISYAHRFFRESIRACQELGCRALILTRFREQLPAALPKNVLHADYVPLSQVLPRAAALVHTGGIGTASQALAAGIPQLIMPLKNDQHDNARRLEQLGVARAFSQRAYRAPAVARALSELLSSPEVGHRCRRLAEQVDPSRFLRETCRLIEQVAEVRWAKAA